MDAPSQRRVVGAVRRAGVSRCGQPYNETSWEDQVAHEPLALRTVAIDTTIARAIGVCATFGTSSGSNTVKVYNHSTLLLN